MGLAGQVASVAGLGEGALAAEPGAEREEEQAAVEPVEEDEGQR